MDHVLTVLGIGCLAFAATNIDNIFVLLAFFAEPRFTPSQVVAGQYLGAGGLIATSIVLSALSFAIAPDYVGLFGFLPLTIGLRRLWTASSGDAMLDPGLKSRSQLLAVTGVTVANGGDNIGVYVPLFTTMSAPELGLVVALFLALTAVWCGAGYWLVRRAMIGRRIRHYGGRALPWVLIALGIYILVRTEALVSL